MLDEKSLTVIEQKQVAFYGDDIIAVRTEDGAIFIPVRPICDLLGVDYENRTQMNTDKHRFFIYDGVPHSCCLLPNINQIKEAAKYSPLNLFAKGCP